MLAIGLNDKSSSLVNEFPVISVIVTTFKRCEYLLNALNSIKKQTISNKMYEVIVVKNFTDELIDQKISEFGYLNIISEGSMGERLAIGIEKSRGRIISFLQDDDLFEPDKLEVTYNLFSDYDDLCFIHNGYRMIDSSGNLVGGTKRSKIKKDVAFSYELKHNLKNISLLIRAGCDFNLSCMSIRKNVIYPYLHDLKFINGSDDSFVFFISLFSEGSVLDYKRCLNRYRVHNSATAKSGTLGEMLKINSSTFLRQIRAFETLKDISPCPNFDKVLYEGIESRKMALNIVATSNVIKRSSINNMLYLLAHHKTLNRGYFFRLILANAIIMLDENTGRRIYYWYVSRKYTNLISQSNREPFERELENSGVL